MRTELLLLIMAGVVISLFLIVGEIAAARKRAEQIYRRFSHLYRIRHLARLLLELILAAAFFMVQPLIVALLVALVLNGIQPDFSSLALRELREAL